MEKPLPPKIILPKYAILGYPQADVSFQIDLRAKTLYLVDLDKEGRSLTNDMSNVAYRILHYQTLIEEPIQLPEFTICYSDSTGDVCGVHCELNQQGGLSHHFYPINLKNLFDRS